MMMSLRLCHAVILLPMVMPMTAVAAHPPVVVELFTSQGCNSCPPADAYLGELSKRPDLITMAFHVDYWNYIGWTDPFAKPWASARQRAYEKSLGERFVYTPQIVVDGTMQGVGSERDTIEDLIRAASDVAPKPGDPTLTLRRREDGALLVEVGGGSSPPHQPADIWLIVYDAQHDTKVARGENEGQELTDYDVVRRYRRIGAWPGWKLELVVPAAEIATPRPGGVIVLVQTADVGRILAAARLPLGH